MLFTNFKAKKIKYDQRVNMATKTTNITFSRKKSKLC